MSTNASESTENICVVCFKNVNIYSIGSCDHMVCYECSTRMRVLCRQNDCPICRQDLPRVVFTKVVKPFTEVQNCSPLEDKKFKIVFQNRKIQDSFYKLLEHSCSVCPTSPTFKTFQYLYDHMKKEHDLYYCDLCVEHLKIFTSERRCYTKKSLDYHKKKGDDDDRSHRGHPLCKFCDVRYMDNDCLYRHLRRDHLYCHFCDADGLDLYYSSYDYLLEHFRTEHYLCEEGSCVDEKFTPVFRTEIDLKAHRASAHGRSLGKAAIKQARTLELEFTLKPRPRHPESSRNNRAVPNEASSSDGAVGGPSNQTSSQMNIPKLDSSDFPSLPSGPVSSVPTLIPQRGHGGGLTIHAIGRKNTPLAINDENFPVLGVSNDAPIPGTSVRLNINQDRSASGSSKGGSSRNVSIHVNHKANGEQKIRIRQDDFPALNVNKKSQSEPTTSNWAVISSKKPTTASLSNSSTSTSKPPPRLDQDFPSLNTKFSTNLNLKLNEPSKPNFVNIKKYKENEIKKKKATSVTIPVENEMSETSESSSNNAKAKSKKKKSKSNNIEEKSDTAKKKSSLESKGKESEVKSETKSALCEASTSGETIDPIKPLPKVEDWFESLKKPGATSEGEKKSDKPTKVSSNSMKFSLTDFPASTNTGLLWCNNNYSTNANNGNDGKKPDSKAPPGFSNFNGCFNNNEVKKPPPGFSADFPRTNGITFTNSSGQSFAISTNFQYAPPVDFEKRNQNLISKVNKLISKDSDLEQFRKMSLSYRQDVLSAKDYFEHCIKAMGDTGLKEIFPELLVLLPDISKQQDLFQVLRANQHYSQSSKNLETCVTCQQVLSKSDIKQHLAYHSMQQNFPVLMSDQWSK